MRQARQNAVETPIPGPPHAEIKLDLLVPYTTPALTAAAVRAADRLGAGLNAVIRLLRIQVVPFPLDLAHSPVPAEFLEAQLSAFQSRLPLCCEVKMARAFAPALKSAVRENTLVLLAARPCPWRTRSERIAASLRRAGCIVILVKGNDKDA